MDEAVGEADGDDGVGAGGASDIERGVSADDQVVVAQRARCRKLKKGPGQSL